MLLVCKRIGRCQGELTLPPAVQRHACTDVLVNKCQCEWLQVHVCTPPHDQSRYIIKYLN